MAIIGTLSKDSEYNPFKADLLDSYVKITAIPSTVVSDIDSDGNNLSTSNIRFVIYHSKQSRNSNGSVFCCHEINIPVELFMDTLMTVDGMFAITYSYLKTLDDFAGFTDDV